MRCLIVLCLVFLSGCVTPMMHPLRADNGFVGQAAFAVNVGHGRTGGCDNEVGCTDNEPGDGGGFFGLQLLQFSAGWAHVIFNHIGLMGGMYFPAHVNQKRTQLDSIAALWSYFTFQTENLSVGIGPEVGTGGWAVTTGAEFRLTDPESAWFPLSVGAYGRRWEPFEEVPRDFNGKIASLEFGGRIGVSVFFAEYSWYKQDSGVQDFVIYETSVYSSGFHIVSVGIDVGAAIRDTRWLK